MTAFGLAIAAGAASGSSSARAASEPLHGTIAFFSARGPGGDNEIYSMNPDGSDVRNLTQNPADDRDPTWSGDGTAIAFSTNRGSGGDYEIYVMNWDGSNQHDITNSPENDRAPNWDIYWNRIYFVREVDARSGGPGGSGEIFRMSPDGSGQTNLTNNPADDRDPTRGFARGFAGSGVLFSSSRGSGGNYEIVEMAPDGSEQTNLTNNAADDREPTLRCSGEYQQDWIAFSSNRVNDADHDIFLMNPYGTNLRRVTSGPSDDRHPFLKNPCPWDVSLVFSRRAPGGNADIYSYEYGSATSLTTDPADDLGPAVSHRPPPPPASPPPPRPPPAPPPAPPPPAQPPIRCHVPRVIGVTLRRARSRIRVAHCSVGRVRRTRSARVGRVLRQDPRPGFVRRRGYPVKLVVGRRRL
jgi:TolB protein